MIEIERARSALWSLDPGCDEKAHFRHACGAADAGLTFDDFHEWSKGGHNYRSESDCHSTWKSASKPGASKKASLYRAALAVGWTDHAKASDKTTRTSLPLARVATMHRKPVKQAASASALSVWERCIAATPAEAYIHRKQGKPDGLRVYPASAPPKVIAGENVTGYLVVPSYAPDGVTLRTLQFIPPDKGKKLNLPGAPMDGFFTVGEITDRVYICEGIGTAWACNAASGAAAVVCFGAGNMAKVAKSLRTQHPAASLVIVPDRGKEADAEKIAADVSGQSVAMPADKPVNYDANDYLLETDPAALLALLECATEPPISYSLSVAFADELTNEFTPPDEIVDGVLTAGDGSILYGDSNSGKTFFVIDMACGVARGVPWMGKQTEPGLVVYLAAESPASVRSRIQAYQRHHGVRVPDFAIVQSPIDLFDGDADTDKLIQLVKQIEWQKRQPARLIICEQCRLSRTEKAGGRRAS